MTDQLLDILKVAFLVLLYLFFIRVLWVVSMEVRATRQANAGISNPAQVTQLADPGPAPVVIPVAPIASQPPPRPTKAPRAKRGLVGRLVVIEPKARRGSTYQVGPEITLGRSPGCTVQITEDAFVSNLHARVFVAEGYLLVEDLGSTNGTYLNSERVSAARPVVKGDRIQVGNTVLEAE